MSIAAPDPAPSPAPRTVRVVLPAFNEAAALPGLLREIAAALTAQHRAYEIIVVDDGSADATAALAEQAAAQLPIVLVRHAANLGLGATLRDGIAAAVARGGAEDVVVTMDADGTHTPALIADMVEAIDRGCDVVIASRYQPGGGVIGVPRLRRVLSDCGSLLFRGLFPTRGVRDYTCGYRAYRAAALRDAMARYGDRFIDQAGFQCMVDVLLKLRALPIAFGEVPLLLRYDRKHGASKMRVLRTAVDTLRLLASRRLRGG
jgi:dolichol-phosphate mannosyltransferase